MRISALEKGLAGMAAAFLLQCSEGEANLLPKARDAVPVASGAADAREPEPSAPTIPLAEMEDDRRRETLIGIVDELDGRYVFPVPDAPEAARRDALSVGRTYYEFGGDRGRHRKHNAVDIYAFGDEVVAFADGEVLMIGRHRHDFDHGNIIVLRHAEADGRALYTYYLHVGAVSSALSVGTRVAKGQPLARVDCTGISDSNWRLYDLGSRRCMEKAHLHFQIRVEDMHVNPNYFFPEYSRDRLPELRGTRLSIPASPLSELEGRVVPFRQGETLGSFREPVGGER